MSDAKKEGAAETPPPPPKAGGSKLMPIMVGVNSLLLVAVVGFMAFTMLKKPAVHAPEGEEGDESAEVEAEKPAEHGEKKAEGGEHGEKKPEKKEAKKEEKKGEKKEGEGEHGEKAASAAGGPGPMVKLADFVIHLRNPELDRYARMSFDVEVMADPDKEQLDANMPRVRDAFIGYLSDRTLEELRGSEGLGRTKDALQARLRELVPEARIRALYISDFVVQ